MKKISPAVIVSRIFDPFIVFSVICLIAALRNLTGAALTNFLTIYFFAVLLPPFILLVWATKTKRINGWDIKDRTERIPAMAIMSLLLVFDLFLFKSFGGIQLFRMFLLFMIWYLGVFIITLFWKISGHAGAVTLFALLAVKWFGLSWWPAFIVIPLVGWSRVKIKNHSVAQVVFGAIYSTVIVLFSLIFIPALLR